MKQSKKANTLPIIVTTGFILLVIIAADVVLRRTQTNILLAAIGILLITLGFVLREASHASLGRNFTYEVSIVEKHELITKGVHSHIRHPAYTGLFLVVVGCSIALGSLTGIIASIIILLPVGIWRVHVEEKVLIEEFGKKYLNYKKKVKAFVPYVF